MVSESQLGPPVATYDWVQRSEVTLTAIAGDTLFLDPWTCIRDQESNLEKRSNVLSISGCNSGKRWGSRSDYLNSMEEASRITFLSLMLTMLSTAQCRYRRSASLLDVEPTKARLLWFLAFPWWSLTSHPAPLKPDRWSQTDPILHFKKSWGGLCQCWRAGGGWAGFWTGSPDSPFTWNHMLASSTDLATQDNAEDPPFTWNHMLASTSSFLDYHKFQRIQGKVLKLPNLEFLFFVQATR